MKRVRPFAFQPFSRKQKQLLTWWMPESPYADWDMVIADGAIRSGKTSAMVLGFLRWSQRCHENRNFIVAGKTMAALKRNLVGPMLEMCSTLGLAYTYIRSGDESRIEVGSNTYYLFGGATEASQDVVQGLTAAGALLDEVALMPRSFVEQCIGRCSVDASRIWMNCNPESPAHFIKIEYIDQAATKRALHLHFTQDDNLSLSPSVKARYRRLYHGLFFKRYVLGLWCPAEGAIYDLWDEARHVCRGIPQGKDGKPARVVRYVAGADYGTGNPTCYLLGAELDDARWVILREYYWDSRANQRQKTDAEYAEDLAAFLGPLMRKAVVASWPAERQARVQPDSGLPDAPLEVCFADPSAASFILAAQRIGLPVVPAHNAVLDGIRVVHSLLGRNALLVDERCGALRRTFPAYVWDPKAQKRGEDKPLKNSEAEDHPLDTLRYLVYSALAPGKGRRIVRVGHG